MFERFGAASELAVRTVETPAPGAREVRVRVRAATVSAEDPKIRSGVHPPLLRWAMGAVYGYRRPRVRVLGMELSGVIDAVGSRVRRWKVGDEVFGYTGVSLGAHAEQRCLDERALIVEKPASLAHEDACALSNGALTALVYLRDLGGLERGQRVLIIGASGCVGTAAVQLARVLGAHVTGVCSAGNVELVRSLGAHEVRDYTREDPLASGARFDVVFDTVNASSFARVQRSLTARGRYLVTHFGLATMARMLWSRWSRGPRVLGTASNLRWNAADLRWIAALASEGALRAVVDRRYPLDAVADAHRYVEQGHKRGNVVLTM